MTGVIHCFSWSAVSKRVAQAKAKPVISHTSARNSDTYDAEMSGMFVRGSQHRPDVENLQSLVVRRIDDMEPNNRMAAAATR